MRTNKIKFTLSVFIIFLPYFLTAQIIGIQGGVEISNFKRTDGVKTDNKTGYNFGLYLGGNVSDNVQINFGVEASLKGALSAQNQQNTVNLTYMQFPLMVSYVLKLVPEKFEIIPSAGIYGAVLAEAKERNEHIEIFTDPYNNDYTDLYKEFDYGLKAGLAVEFVRSMQIGAEYCYGLGSVAKDNSVKNNYGIRLYIRFLLN